MWLDRDHRHVRCEGGRVQAVEPMVRTNVYHGGGPVLTLGSEHGRGEDEEVLLHGREGRAGRARRGGSVCVTMVVGGAVVVAVVVLVVDGEVEGGTHSPPPVQRNG